ncbi:MAG: twin-arginine translocation signal domain-containing protein [Actinobacteria bacterium]|nr:twin-arginine translocation signal domain-containing protein [Actinomycetota bacterium]
MSNGDREGLNRRDFLRKAAMTTAAAAWAAPVIQSVAATPAFAQAQGTPPPTEDGCAHSVGPNGGCMGACASVCGGNQCGGQGNRNQAPGPCTVYCPPGTGSENPCANPGLCEPGNFVCSSDQQGVATYTGPL